jgi:hypothetical protein
VNLCVLRDSVFFGAPRKTGTQRTQRRNRGIA